MEKSYGDFVGKARLYAKYRPSYSSRYKEYLTNSVGFSLESSVADIGAGTGIHTKVLADISDRIYCVEPDSSMLQICNEIFKNYGHIVTLLGTAECTGLSEESVEYITVAQAFHLFNYSKCLAEFQRILKKNGKLILVWNSKEHDNELFYDVENVVKEFCPRYKRNIHARYFSQDTYRFCFDSSTYIFTRLQHDSTEFLCKDVFVQRTLSASYAITRREALYHAFIEELENVFNKHSEKGTVKVPQSTVIYHGKIKEQKHDEQLH